MKIVLGIDPGLNGAIAELDTVTGALVRLTDMPTIIGEGARNRRAVNALLLAYMISSSNTLHVYCELVGPRPTDGVVGAFGFGRIRGLIEGVCAALGIPVTFVSAATWKYYAAIPAGKDYKNIARSRAISQWPSQAHLFARKADIDRAEACLVGLAGIEVLSGAKAA